MNIQDWGAVGEILGAAGVIVTLIYLAKQIRGNSRQMHVTAVISINHLINEAWDPIYNNDRNIRVWTTGQKEPAKLDEEDLALFHLFMARLTTVLTTAISQLRYDALDTEEFRRYAETTNALLQSPGGQRWLAEGGEAIISGEVREVLDEYGAVSIKGFAE
jgi:hypothetical protein